jgi:transposase
MRRLRTNIMTDVNDDAKGVYRRVEVLTGPDRRRRWSDEQKILIAAEAMVPGAVVAQIARRWQICPSQVFTWRRLALGATPSNAPAITPVFVPIVEAAVIPDTPPSELAPALVAEIEIDTGGAKIRVAGGVDTKTLTAVLRAGAGGRLMMTIVIGADIV